MLITTESSFRSFRPLIPHFFFQFRHGFLFFLFNWKVFFVLYILIMFFSSNSSYTANFMFLISLLKQNKTKQKNSGNTQKHTCKTTKIEIKIYKQKANKTKKFPKKENETKSLQNFLWVHFVLANYPWAWGLPWGVVNRPSETSLEGTESPSGSRCYPAKSSPLTTHFPAWLFLRSCCLCLCWKVFLLIFHFSF